MVKALFIFLLVLPPSLVYSQSYSISDEVISTCTGTIFDTGGSSSGYSNDENHTLTVCPGNTSDIISLNFSTFDLGSTNLDSLTVYDGNNTNSSLIGVYTFNQLQGSTVIASSVNPTGCLTVVFKSNSSVTGNFEATIFCSPSCDRPFAQAVSTPDTVATICIAEAVSFDGSTSFAQGTANIVSYHWHFNTGTIDSTSGATAIDTFNNEGIFAIQLYVIDDNNCISSNLTNSNIWVAPEPIFFPLYYDSLMCIGESADFIAHPDQYTQTWWDTPGGNTGNYIYIPDITGQCITSTLDVSGFPSGLTLDSINEIAKVCVNMEHTFMGDLSITLTCPSGQSVILHQQGGGGTDLGDPIQPGGSQTQDVGWDYCWSPTATNGTWVDNSQTDTITNSSGLASLIPGDYESLNPMNTLVGCSLNGIWEIEFCDLWGGDDGHVFGWEVKFDTSLLYTYSSTSFTPVIGYQIDSSSWSGPNISNLSTDGNQITITPLSAGTYSYTYTVTNDFGCTSDTSVSIIVNDLPEVFAGQDTSACSGELLQLNGDILNYTQVQNCTFSLNLFDSFGDGWNGSSIDIVINGSATNYGMNSGSDTTYTFLLNPGDTLDVVFNSGSFDSECMYTIRNCDSLSIFSNGPNPTIGNAFHFIHENSLTYIYQWTPSTGLSDSTILDPISTFTGQIDYVLNVFQTDHPLCLAMDTISVTFDTCTNIISEEVFMPKIYPNPFNTEINLLFNKTESGVNISLMNNIGQKISGSKDVSVMINETIVFRTATLPPGIYFLTVECNNYTFTKKLVVQ